MTRRSRPAPGNPSPDLRSEFFDSFGVSEPQPVEPLPLDGSDVSLARLGVGQRLGQRLAADGSDGAGSSDLAWVLIIGLVVVGVVFVAVVVVRSRPRPAPPVAVRPNRRAPGRTP